ncbi:MAG: hypothetical protein H6Q64_1622 [Firmicutes bacterium]|nr:hypothetical protein [Bacillota bacterium]
MKDILRTNGFRRNLSTKNKMPDPAEIDVNHQAEKAFVKTRELF